MITLQFTGDGDIEHAQEHGGFTELDESGPTGSMGKISRIESRKMEHVFVCFRFEKEAKGHMETRNVFSTPQ